MFNVQPLWSKLISLPPPVTLGSQLPFHGAWLVRTGTKGGDDIDIVLKEKRERGKRPVPTCVTTGAARGGRRMGGAAISAPVLPDASNPLILRASTRFGRRLCTTEIGPSTVDVAHDLSFLLIHRARLEARNTTVLPVWDFKIKAFMSASKACSMGTWVSG